MQQNPQKERRTEKLIKKCRSEGFDSLTDDEAAELFLGYASRSTDSLALKEKITDGDACSFFDLSREELIQRGVSQTAAFLIEKFPEIASRCIDAQPPGNTAGSVSKAEQQKKLLQRMIVNKFMGAKVEKVLLALFHADGRLIYFDFVSTGSNTISYFDDAKICKLASSNMALCAVVAHNHPSGSLIPSPSDCKSTFVLYQKLRSVGVVLVDHFIVNRTTCESIRSTYDFTDRNEQYLEDTMNRLSAESGRFRIK